MANCACGWKGSKAPGHNTGPILWVKWRHGSRSIEVVDCLYESVSAQRYALEWNDYHHGGSHFTTEGTAAAPDDVEVVHDWFNRIEDESRQRAMRQSQSQVEIQFTFDGNRYKERHSPDYVDGRVAELERFGIKVKRVGAKARST